MSVHIPVITQSESVKNNKNSFHFSGVRELHFDDNRGFSVFLRIPDGNKSVLCVIFLEYLSRPAFSKYARGTQTNYASYVVTFFNFLSKNNYTNDSCIPNSVLTEFVQYMKDIKLGKSTIHQSNIFIIKVIKHYALDTDNLKKEKFWGYLSKAKKVRVSPSNPIKSMSAYFNTGFSDTELIRSLRIICSWVLLEHDRQRKLLLSRPEIQKQLIWLRTIPVDKPPLCAGRLYAGNIKTLTKDIIKEVELSQKAYAVLLKSVLKSGDEMLFERVVTGFKHNLGSVLTKIDTQTIIERMFGVGMSSQKNEIITHIRLPKNITTKTRMVISYMQSLTFRHLVAPSEAEIFAAQCLFASDRIQTSNQARQTLNDVETNSDGLQVQHGKGRANRTFTTGIYAPNSLIESALKSYVDSCFSWKDWTGNKEGELLFPYFGNRTNQCRGVLGQFNSSNWSFFKSLVLSGSATNNKFINDVTEGDSKPFIKWLSALIKHNTDKSVKGSIGLTTSMIGQSRNYMESSVTVTEKKSEETVISDDPQITSNLKAHTLSTRRRVYDDRAPKETIDYDFSRRVAELIEQDAGKIGEYLRKTKVVDLKEAKKLLGCETLQDDMQSILQKVDADIGLMGEFQNENETIFVANELTAALLHLRIIHLNNEMPKLLNDPFSHSKALNAASKRVYLEKVLSQFPKSIVKAGIIFSKTLNVPFESLI